MIDEFNKAVQGFDIGQLGDPSAYLVQDIANKGAVTGLADLGFQVEEPGPAPAVNGPAIPAVTAGKLGR